MFGGSISAFLHGLRWQDGADVLLLTVLFSWAYTWMRRTIAVQMTLGMVTLLAASWIASHFGLILTSYLLSAVSAVATIVVVVVFQREIRRGLSRASPLRWIRKWSRKPRVEAPAAMLRAGRRVFLNFGEGTVVDPASERRAPSGMRAWMESPVREAAQVFVNGKAAGAVWKAPFEVEVTGLLKPGENAIRVVVANLALNVLAKGPLPDYKELTAKYGEKFQAQDMQSVRPLPAGILGPVRLVGK